MSYFGDDDDYNSSEYNESGSDSEEETNIRNNKKQPFVKNNKTPLALPITDENDNEVDIELSDEDEDIEDENDEQYGGVADDDYEEEDDIVVNNKKTKDLEEEEEEDENEPMYEGETKQIKQIKQIAQKLIQNNSDNEEEDEEEDGEIYLKKFNENIHKNYILNFHPECSLQNYDEIISLTKVVRDKSNIIIDPLHRTIPYLTKYERTRILGQRAKQINSGAIPFVKVPENVIDGYLIAELELQQKRIPFIIRRPLPNGGSEYWRVRDLENIAF